MMNKTKHILGDLLGLSAAPVVLHVGAVAIGSGASPLLALPVLALSGVVTAQVVGHNFDDWMSYRQNKKDGNAQGVYTSGLVGSILTRRQQKAQHVAEQTTSTVPSPDPASPQVGSAPKM